MYFINFVLGSNPNLGLDVSLGLAVLLQPLNLDLTVKVTNVAHNGVVLHLKEMLADEDVLAAGGGHEDVAPGDCVVHGGHLVALHGSLQGIDGVNLGDDDSAAEAAEGLGGSLADISVSGDERSLTGQHDVGGALDTVHQGLPAAVQVVKLGLCHGVVDVDGGDLQGAVLEHLVQVVHT